MTALVFTPRLTMRVQSIIDLPPSSLSVNESGDFLTWIKLRNPQFVSS